MNYDPTVTEHHGKYGTAVKIPVIPVDAPARNSSESVAYYLITAPAFHPAWSQYFLMTIRLRDVPGLPPPDLDFDGATHQMAVLVADPRHVWTAEKIVAAKFTVPHLRPWNIVIQHEGTDEEMAHLTDLAAQAVVHGALNPETGDAPTHIREQWLTASVKTLAHIRGEEHAP